MLKKDQIFNFDIHNAMKKGNLIERFFHKSRLNAILNSTNFNSKKTLDAGCGSGLMLIPLAKKRAIMSGIDLSKYAINILKEHCKKLNIKADLKVGDLKKNNYKDNHFDITILADVLEHIVNPEIAVREAERITKKKKGLILVTAPSMIHGCKYLKLLSSRKVKEEDLEHPIKASEIKKMFKNSRLIKKSRFAFFTEHFFKFRVEK